jgi:hypothetical protein
MAYHTRGRVVCPNNLEVPLQAADQGVLAAVERDLLRVEVLETSLAKVLDLGRPDGETFEVQAQEARKALGQLDAEVARLAAAIAAGGELSALLAALRERDQRHAQLRAELAALERVTQTAGPFEVGDVLDELRESLTDWQGLLRQEAPQARQALPALLAGRLIFTPTGEGRARYYEFAGPGTLRKVIAGLALPMELVPPEGTARSDIERLTGTVRLRAA